MPRRWMHLCVGAALVVALAGCGRIHQRNEHYVATEPPASPRVLVGFHTTHTDSGSGKLFGDREIYDGVPYTAFLSVRAPEQVDAPLVVRGATLVIGEQRIALHDETAPPLTAAFELGSGTDPWSAMVRLPLGDRLSFVEGQLISLDFDATLPGEAAATHVVRSFRGEARDIDGLKLDEIVGQ